MDEYEELDEHISALSEQAATILGLIAEGRSYDQILQRYPALTYFDIFAAAREALDRLQTASARPPTRSEPVTHPAEPSPTKRLPAQIERARATHPRAWARWTRDEDQRLRALFAQGSSRAAIAEALGRQPGAITSRLLKLGLIADPDLDPAPADVEVTPSRPTAADRRRATVVPAVQPPTSTSTSPASVVPGWEALRDRLSPDEASPDPRSS